MKTSFIYAITLLAMGLVALPSSAQIPDPTTHQTFDQYISSLHQIQNYTFGTDASRTVQNLSQLAGSFDPYGIAGTIVIHQEWERYQPFNEENFAFTPTSLNLTATIPAGGGLYPGGIHSGQIFTQQTFKPDVTGYSVYAFEVRMKIPSGPGMWCGAWFYTKHWGQDDGSEIDNPEFYVMQWQNELDWTGYQHGPGMGATLYNIKSNPWTYHPNLNFSADYHDYQTIWTPDAVYKYVDGTLIYAQQFKWTAKGPAQLGVSLAWGSSDTADLPGLQPNSLSEFPAALSVDHIKIWAQ